MAETPDLTLDQIVALCKRRGFIFPSSEIYGGFANTYDYGHYGVLLKNNVKAEWWRAMLQERDDIVAIDSAIIQNPRVWEASGHLEGFWPHWAFSRSSARKRCLQWRQSTSGSVKPARWPEASHVRGCMMIAASRATMSSRSRTIARHHSFLTLFFSSTP